MLNADKMDIQTNPYNYEAWHRYIDFAKSKGNKERTREIFEMAIENIPREMKYSSEWLPYIHLWLKYAWFEEFEAKDAERARNVYSRCLRLIPHHKFSFEEVWIWAAKLEINQKNYGNARLLFESAIEKAATANIFRTYIEMTKRQLGDIIGCQKLYMRYIQWSPDDDYSCWIEFVEFEKSKSNPDQARAIYDNAIRQPALRYSVPLWCSYIDFETSENKIWKARILLEMLLRFNKQQVSIWIKYARFEAFLAEKLLKEEEEDVKKKSKRVMSSEIYIQRTRGVFKRALLYFEDSTGQNFELQNRNRNILLREWTSLELKFGSSGNVNLIAGFNRSQEILVFS